MRAALIAVFVAVWGSALPAMAQVAVNRAIASVAETMVAAPRCGVTFDRDVARQVLATAGYDEANAQHVAEFDLSLQEKRLYWSHRTQDEIKTECDLLWQSFGPDGLVRKGLLRK